MSGFDFFVVQCFWNNCPKICRSIRIHVHYPDCEPEFVLISYVKVEKQFNIRFHRTEYQSDNSLYSIRTCYNYITQPRRSSITDSKI